MRLVLDVEFNKQVIDKALDEGTYVDLLKQMGEEMFEDTDGNNRDWRITKVATHAAPKAIISRNAWQ